MKVESTHHVDASERDARGFYQWRYEYDIHRFTEGEVTLVARSYVDEPQEAHFLRTEEGGTSRFVSESDVATPLFREAVDYLRRSGKLVLRRLGDDGYEPIA